MWELSLNTRLPRTVRAVVYAPLGAVASHCPDVTLQGTTWLLWTSTTGAMPTAVLLACASAMMLSLWQGTRGVNSRAFCGQNITRAAAFMSQACFGRDSANDNRA